MVNECMQRKSRQIFVSAIFPRTVSVFHLHVSIIPPSGDVLQHWEYFQGEFRDTHTVPICFCLTYTHTYAQTHGRWIPNLATHNSCQKCEHHRDNYPACSSGFGWKLYPTHTDTHCAHTFIKLNTKWYIRSSNRWDCNAFIHSENTFNLQTAY